MAADRTGGAMDPGAPHYHVWSSIDYKPVIRCMLPYALFDHIHHDMTVLEIGCGEGEVSRELARRGLRVTGIDINAAAIEAARSCSVDATLADRLQFKHADILTAEIAAEFDLVVMIRLLTCFPIEEEWRAVLNTAWRALKPRGLLYVHDFAYTADRSVYAERYRRGVTSGYRHGAFAVPSTDGALLFVAYHHDEAAIATIKAPYDEVVFDRHQGQSMNGNATEMFEFLGRKMGTA